MPSKEIVDSETIKQTIWLFRDSRFLFVGEISPQLNQSRLSKAAQFRQVVVDAN